MEENQSAISSEWVTLQVSDGTSMQAYSVRPEGSGAFPGILVFQEAFGVNAHIRDIAERFARHGYHALAPEIFHRTAAPGFEGAYDDFAAIMPHFKALTNEALIADIQASHAWLSKSGSFEEVSTIGFCLGGRLAFLANSVVKLKAAVSFYGGGIAPNPYMPEGLLDRAPLQNAPILLIWGGLDTHITSEQTSAVTAALKEAAKTFVQVNFAAADHGFFCDARSSYHAASAEQAWALTLQFLRKPA